jgi:hypothetical protein
METAGSTYNGSARTGMYVMMYAMMFKMILVNEGMISLVLLFIL